MPYVAVSPVHGDGSARRFSLNTLRRLYNSNLNQKNDHIKVFSRRYFFLFFANPKSSTAAAIYNRIVEICALISCLLFFLRTLDGPNQGGTDPDYPDLPEKNTYIYWDGFFTAIFTLEFLFRLFLWPSIYHYTVELMEMSQKPFILDIWNWFDLISFLPFYVDMIFPSATKTLVLLRLSRLLRIFKIARNQTGTFVLIRAIKASIPPLKVAIFFLMEIVVLFGTLMYVADPCYSKDTCTFSDILNAAYFIVVTIATVGFGDIVPNEGNMFGRCAALFIIIIGTLFLSMPLAIIGTEFDRSWREFSTEQKKVGNDSSHDSFEQVVLSLEKSNNRFEVLSNYDVPNRIYLKFSIAINKISRSITKLDKIFKDIYIINDNHKTNDPIIDEDINKDTSKETNKETNKEANKRTEKDSSITSTKNKTNKNNDFILTKNTIQDNEKHKELLSQFDISLSSFNDGIVEHSKLVSAIRLLIRIKENKDKEKLDIRLKLREIFYSFPGMIRTLTETSTEIEVNTITNTNPNPNSNPNVLHKQGSTITNNGLNNAMIQPMESKRSIHSSSSSLITIKSMQIFYNMSLTAKRCRRILNWIAIISIIIAVFETMPELHQLGEKSHLCEVSVKKYCSSITNSTEDPGCFVYKSNIFNSKTLNSSTKLIFDCTTNEKNNNERCYGYGLNYGSTQKNALSCFSGTIRPFRNKKMIDKDGNKNKLNDICNLLQCDNNRVTFLDLNASWEILEAFIAFIFFIEMILYFYTLNDIEVFFRDPIVWIEIISIIPVFILEFQRITTLRNPDYAIPPGSVDGFTVLRLLRVLRLYKISREVRGVGVAYEAIKLTWKRLTIPYFVLGITTIVLSFLIYEFEKGTECFLGVDCIVNNKNITYPEITNDFPLNKRVLINSKGNLTRFVDFYSALWFVVVTISTVGYGDLVPLTSMGKAVAVFAAIFGACYTAMPLTLVGGQFSRSYSKFRLKEALTRTKVEAASLVPLTDDDVVMWEKFVKAHMFLAQLSLKVAKLKEVCSGKGLTDKNKEQSNISQVILQRKLSNISTTLSTNELKNDKILSPDELNVKLDDIDKDILNDHIEKMNEITNDLKEYKKLTFYIGSIVSRIQKEGMRLAYLQREAIQEI